MSMIARFKFGLRWKLNVLIGAVLVVTMVIFEGMSLHHEKGLLLSARAHHLQELAQHFGWVVQRADGQNQQNLVMDYERALNRSENHDYRALRPTTLIYDNSGVICDFVKYARMSFEYQRLDNGVAVNRYRLGPQFNS